MQNLMEINKFQIIWFLKSIWKVFLQLIWTTNCTIDQFTAAATLLHPDHLMSNVVKFSQVFETNEDDV